MAREKAPAFQFYPRDFIADSNVIVMDNAEVGVYVKLMCACWSDGSIPDDIGELSRLVQETPRKLEKMWQRVGRCFVTGDAGRLIHPRLERERKAQEEHRARKVEAGRKGGKAKAKAKQKASSATAERLAKPSPSSSPASAKDTSPSGEGSEQVKSWSAKAVDAWTDRFGGTAPAGRIGAALKPLVEKYGDGPVLGSWAHYLANEDAKFANPQTFAQKYGEWAGRQSRRKGGPERFDYSNSTTDSEEMSWAS